MIGDAPALLEAVGVSRAFGRQLALSGVDLRLCVSRTLGIIGPSGAGKSTLARLLAGMDRPSAGCIRLDGRDVATPAGHGVRELHGRVQILPQEPAAALDALWTVGAIIAEGSARPRAQRAAQVQALLAAVGLPPALFSAHPHELSGGQAQRVALARALCPEPAALIADEPTAALDPLSAAGLAGLLRELRERRGLTWALVSHDLALVARLCDDVVVLCGGRVVETGPAGLVLDAPAHPQTQALVAAAAGAPPPLAAAPGPAPARGCAFVERCPVAIPRCRAVAPPLRALPGGRQLACHAAQAEDPPTGPPGP